MAHISRKNLYLAIPVLIIEGATMWSLQGAYSFHEHPLAAAMIAISFSALLIGVAVLVAQTVSPAMRALLVAGGVLLFLVQALSNISMAYLHADGVLPAEELAHLWSTSPDGWRMTSSWIYGCTLNIVGAIFWIALSLHYREEELRAERRNDLLDELLSRSGRG